MGEKSRLDFMTYIAMLYQSGLIAMGMMENPVTRKTETDPDGAGTILDLMRMLREKTAGNLTEEERETLEALCSNLELSLGGFPDSTSPFPGMIPDGDNVEIH